MRKKQERHQFSKSEYFIIFVNIWVPVIVLVIFTNMHVIVYTLQYLRSINYLNNQINLCLHLYCGAVVRVQSIDANSRQCCHKGAVDRRQRGGAVMK